MKLISLPFVTTVMILVVGATTWHVSAQQQTPANQASTLRDPLADWQYPDARFSGESNHERLSTIPLHGILARTPDSIATVYAFYRKKCESNFVAQNAWKPNSQPAMLMVQYPQGQTATFLDATRQDADSALMVIRQMKRTITVQLSRDPKDKATTDILLIADEH